MHIVSCYTVTKTTVVDGERKQKMETVTTERYVEKLVQMDGRDVDKIEVSTNNSNGSRNDGALTNN